MGLQVSGVCGGPAKEGSLQKLPGAVWQSTPRHRHHRGAPERGLGLAQQVVGVPQRKALALPFRTCPQHPFPAPATARAHPPDVAAACIRDARSKEVEALQIGEGRQVLHACAGAEGRGQFTRGLRNRRLACKCPERACTAQLPLSQSPQARPGAATRAAQPETTESRARRLRCPAATLLVEKQCSRPPLASPAPASPARLRQ